eukprot:419230-Hanusia_phi.AAC.1
MWGGRGCLQRADIPPGGSKGAGAELQMGDEKTLLGQVQALRRTPGMQQMRKRVGVGWGGSHELRRAITVDVTGNDVFQELLG